MTGEGDEPDLHAWPIDMECTYTDNNHCSSGYSTCILM